MGRTTTGIIVLIVIVLLLLIGVISLAQLGNHMVAVETVGEGGASTPVTPASPAVATTAAPDSATPPSVASAPTWQPHPDSTLPLTRLSYRYFSIGYDEQARNPAWVVYQLQGPITHHGREHRPALFATEMRTAAKVTHRDYNGSGFDRGHMCPAYAMFSRFGEEGMQTTFVMANVIPQYHEVNAGEWEHLETEIAGRDGHGNGWAGDSPLWIINGPVYDHRPASASLRNRTWVPSACFSVILRKPDGHWDALAVEMPNQERIAGPWTRYVTTIEAIERDTGIDILAGLAAPERQHLEHLHASAGWR